MTDAPTKRFLRPGKLALLILLGVLVYFCALVVLIPAGWVWHQASSRVVLPSQVQIHQVTGKVWAGAAVASVQGILVQLDWRLGLPSLSGLTLPVEFDARTAQSSLQGDLEVTWPASARLNARGSVHVPEFETLIRQSGGAMLEGDIAIDRLQLELADQNIRQASGYGRWPGGMVTWPMGAQTGSARFPPMEATLDSAANGVALTVMEQGGAGPAAVANILANGMLDLRVFKRMVDLAGQPWSGAASPDDVIFSVRQPLLPGGRL
ncbi:type II secretion system protein N [Pseudidiomarina gelatinasegens]|uniref:type II secretion system protein N n=1 Tax=Pseudidiomarina gelatinasegens TaxID=2487740 RepID=UPI003A97C2FD